MAPRAWKASPRLSWPSLRPAMAPQWPARPRTAVIWLPKATDGTSGLKTLAAPQPAQSSSSNGASVASQAQDSSYMDSENDGWHLGLERPRRASAGPVMLSESDGWHLGLERPRRASAGPAFIQQWRQVASQDSSYVDSESRGWHPGLDKRRRASAGPVFVQQWRLRGQPGPGQQLYGFRKRRMAPRAWKPSPRLSRPSNAFRKRRMAPRAWKASPRLSRPSLRPAMAPQWPARPRTAVGFRKQRMAPWAWQASPRLSRTCLRPAMAPQWPARPRTAIICFPRATDGTSRLKGLAAPAPDSGDSR